MGNIIIFGISKSFSVHTNCKNKNISVLGEKKIQGLDNSTIPVEVRYPNSPICAL